MRECQTAQSFCNIYRWAESKCHHSPPKGVQPRGCLNLLHLSPLEFIGVTTDKAGQTERKPGIAEMLAHCAEFANANQALEKCSKLWLIQQKEGKKKISSNVCLLSKLCVLFTNMRATEQNRWIFWLFLSFFTLRG